MKEQERRVGEREKVTYHMIRTKAGKLAPNTQGPRKKRLAAIEEGDSSHVVLLSRRLR